MNPPEVLFEEYTYYGSLTRAEVHSNTKTDPATIGIWKVIFPPKSWAGIKPVLFGKSLSLWWTLDRDRSLFRMIGKEIVARIITMWFLK